MIFAVAKENMNVHMYSYDSVLFILNNFFEMLQQSSAVYQPLLFVIKTRSMKLQNDQTPCNEQNTFIKLSVIHML